MRQACALFHASSARAAVFGTSSSAPAQREPAIAASHSSRDCAGESSTGSSPPAYCASSWQRPTKESRGRMSASSQTDRPLPAWKSSNWARSIWARRRFGVTTVIPAAWPAARRSNSSGLESAAGAIRPQCNLLLRHFVLLVHLVHLLHFVHLVFLLHLVLGLGGHGEGKAGGGEHGEGFFHGGSCLLGLKGNPPIGRPARPSLTNEWGIIPLHGRQRGAVTGTGPIRAEHRLPYPVPDSDHRAGVVPGLLPHAVWPQRIV